MEEEIWRGGCSFGIKLSVVGPTGDETTGEVRQQLLYRVIKPVTESFSTALNRPVSVTEDERVTQRESFAYTVSDFYIESTQCLSFYMNLKICGTLRAQQLLQDDKS